MPGLCFLFPPAGDNPKKPRGKSHVRGSQLTTKGLPQKENMSNKTEQIEGNQAQQSTRPVPAKARQLLQDQCSGLPVWIRCPKNGVEFYSGFSRAKLYEGAGKGLFRSVSIRAPGQVKGTRLFHLQSILAFIERCEEGKPSCATSITNDRGEPA